MLIRSSHAYISRVTGWRGPSSTAWSTQNVNVLGGFDSLTGAP